MPVLISNRQKDVSIDKKFIKEAGQSIIEILSIPNAELSVSFVSEEESFKLNSNYRDKEKVAEVLSFPMNENDIIGDVVIAPSMSKKVIAESKITLNERLAFLLVHGVLHLKGFTHENDANAIEMEESEDNILKKLKSKGIF